MKNLERKFKSVVPHKNFMTPNVEGYFEKGDYICELSSGYIFCGLYVFGVTTINAKTMKHESEKSKSFFHCIEEQAKNNALNFIHSIG